MSIVAGDVGTELVIDVQVDISNASECRIYSKSPHGTIRSWPVVETGAAVGSAHVTDTRAHYILQADDIPATEPGRWIYQLYVELPGGWEGCSPPIYDIVFPKLSV